MLLILAAIILSIFWIWMLIDCIYNEEIKGSEKAFFLLIIIFLHWIGGAIYCFSANRKERLGCFPIMVIIVASFVSFLSLYGAIKLIYEYKNPTLVNAKKIINKVEKVVLRPEPRPYVPLKQSDIDKKLINPRDELKQNKYLLLNKSDENRKPAQTANEIANINTAKYSEKLNSWVDSKGKVHFSNANLQPATK